MSTERFQSADDYRKWNAYRHMHGIKAPGLKRVCVKGKGCHKVQHSKAAKHKAARKRG